MFKWLGQKTSRVDKCWWVLTRPWQILNNSTCDTFLFVVLGCDRTLISDDVKRCSALVSTTSTASPTTADPILEKSAQNASAVTQLEPKTSSAGFVTTICSIFAMVFVAVIWVFYAYTHPHTTSGQFLIQYGRPQAWSWRRGEARYTAATIHMWKYRLMLLKAFSYFSFFFVLSCSMGWFMWWSNTKPFPHRPYLSLTLYLSLINYTWRKDFLGIDLNPRASFAIT